MNVADAQTWCVIPVKGFTRAKSRLASMLGPAARAALSEQMFMRVVSLSASEPRLGATLVATDDDRVETLARTMGAQVLRDGGDDVLGRIVDRALEYVMHAGAQRVVVLMSDLPRLRPEDLGAALDALLDAHVVIAPDRAQLGTNLLGLQVPAPFITCFGRADSFAAHVEAARQSVLRAVIIDRPGLAFDLDTPEDYMKLSQS